MEDCTIEINPRGGLTVTFRPRESFPGFQEFDTAQRAAQAAAIATALGFRPFLIGMGGNEHFRFTQ